MTVNQEAERPTPGRPAITKDAGLPRRWWALGALALTGLTIGIQSTVTNVALPQLSTALHATTGQLQWIASAFTLVAGVGMLPAANLADRYGRKRLLAGSLDYWVGPPGVERGYNVLLVDLPGMGLNTFQGIYFRPDTEVAVGACIDYLSKRGDVDPSRIAFYGGGEPGGWVAVRAAAHEPRIAACIADPYVADSDAILSVIHRPDVAALSDGPQTVPGQAEQTARFYEGEPGRGYARMVAEPERIQCPLLCLNDPTDQEELRRQAAAAVEAAPNPASRHQVFAPEDGTVLYRQLDNFSLKHRVMFDWLDEVLDQR